MSSVSTIRQDPLSGAYAVIAPGRFGIGGGWPRTPAALPELRGRCPFCPGHESDTEVLVVTRPDTDCWRVRVVRNLYPVVSVATQLDHLGTGSPSGAPGIHEVVVESSAHDADIATMGTSALAEVLDVYRERLAALAQEPGILHVAIFRNRGLRAGSSQPHPHGQVVALPIVASQVALRAERARVFAREQRQSLLRSVIETELSDGLRVVAESARFVAFCPFASAWPFQVTLAPRDGVGAFSALAPAALDELAAMLETVLRSVLAATGGAAYNLIFRLPPLALRGALELYWSLDVLPRLGGPAGFELTTGAQINTVPPEDAAAALRRAAESGS